jgi:uncharacterized protein with PIN domain
MNKKITTMKNIMALFICLIFGSCSSPVKPETIKEDVCTQYACPMHRDKTSSKPAECPECHREMVPVSHKQKKDTVIKKAPEALSGNHEEIKDNII